MPVPGAGHGKRIISPGLYRMAPQGGGGTGWLYVRQLPRPRRIVGEILTPDDLRGYLWGVDFGPATESPTQTLKLRFSLTRLLRKRSGY